VSAISRVTGGEPVAGDQRVARVLPGREGGDGGPGLRERGQVLGAVDGDVNGALRQCPADRRPEHARCRRAVSGPISDDAEQAEALELLRSSAAWERAAEVLREYADRARTRLTGVPAGPVREALSALCEYVVPRTG
jgi:hypothetical protein